MSYIISKRMLAEMGNPDVIRRLNEQEPHHWQIKDGRTGWLLHKTDTYKEGVAWRRQWHNTGYMGFTAENMVIVPRFHGGDHA